MVNMALITQTEDLSCKNLKEIPEVIEQRLLVTYETVDNMKVLNVIEKLKCFHLNADPTESVEELKVKLKSKYKDIILGSTKLVFSKRLLPFYVVIDFEATCEEKDKTYRPEIIEFPAVLVSSQDLKIIDYFQMYCKPQINPILSKYCTDLTGITQEQVDSAETFDKVLIHFQKWLEKHKLNSSRKFAIVTDSHWDIKKYLYYQCIYLCLPFPIWANSWVNVSVACRKFYRLKKTSLQYMLDHLDMKFIGNHHCGLDDAKNIARILIKMIYDGADIRVNQQILLNKSKIIRLYKREKSESCNKENSENNFNVEKKIPWAGIRNIGNGKTMANYATKKRERLILEARMTK